MVSALAVISAIGSLSVVPLTVTVGLHLMNQRAARREAIAAREQRLIEDVLDVVARTLHRQTSVVRYIDAPPEVDFGALYPRVLLNVGKGNEAIAAWVLRQVQLMLLSTDQQEPIRRGGIIAAQLMAWQRKDVALAWFEEELNRDPVDHEFKVPFRVRAVRLRRQAGLGALIGLGIGATGLLWRGLSA